MTPDSAVPSTAAPAESADTASNPGGDTLPEGARVVLRADDVARGLRRMAHEILERNKGADDLV